MVIPTGCHARCAGTVRALLESLVRTDRTWLGEKGLVRNYGFREGPEGLPRRLGSGGSDVKLNADGGRGAQTPPPLGQLCLMGGSRAQGRFPRCTGRPDAGPSSPGEPLSTLSAEQAHRPSRHFCVEQPASYQACPWAPWATPQHDI